MISFDGLEVLVVSRLHSVVVKGVIAAERISIGGSAIICGSMITIALDKITDSA